MPSLRDALRSLQEDSRSLWLPSRVQEYQTPSDSLQFLREHVAQSVPCVWRGCAREWKAVQLWGDDNLDYLRERVGENLVQVAWTPDGRADAIVQCEHSDYDKVFAMPFQKTQPLQQVLDELVKSQRAEQPSYDDVLHTDYTVGDGGGAVPYYSAQDSSLSREVPGLLEDVDDSVIDFAKAAFGAEASATNIWIGDGRSVTSTHADPFENMYAVVAGTKIIELRPPCDAALLQKPALQRARWVPTEGMVTTSELHDSNYRREELLPLKQYAGWNLLKEDGSTEWIDEGENDAEFAGNVIVELHAGDVLYLPCLWFHKVRQVGVTIAVNWWFEMYFGRDWIYKELCFRLGRCELEGAGRSVRVAVDNAVESDIPPAAGGALKVASDSKSWTRFQ